MDSSGIVHMNMTKNEYNLHKLPVMGSFFVDDKVASGIIRDTNKQDTLTICHTRHSTVGSVNLSSAHPFKCGKDDDRILLGCHNGTLTNWRGHKGASTYTVDSEWALNHIMTERFDAFEDFEGAFCFVWWDSEDRDFLNIARNKERPMHVVMLESGGMAYASEAGMLHWLLERRGIKTTGSILSLEEGYWYKFPNENPANFSRTKLPTVKTRTYINYPVRSGYNHETVVQKVQKLFDKAVKQASLALEPKTSRAKSSLVAQDEYDAALTMEMIGEEALFTPFSLWTNNVEGTALIQGAELNAVVRGCPGSTFSYGETWHCTIIGIEDNGQDMTAILGPPTLKEHADDRQTANAN